MNSRIDQSSSIGLALEGRVAMIARSTRKGIVAVLIATVVLLCLGDLIELGVPRGDHPPCASHLCDEHTGCGTVPAKPVAAPTATLVACLVVAPPAVIRSLSYPVALLPPRDRQVAPLAPRSPPPSA